jgi:exoribonuclease II
VDKGTLVEFRLQGQTRLAVVDRPEGKKNWIAIDQHQHSHTLHPRQITYAVQGRPYQAQEIGAFLRESSAYLQPDSLEVAWELLLEEGKAVSAAQMAQLLFSQQEPAQCYAAHCLLAEDKLYFKLKGDLYEPRPASQVNELKHQLEREGQRQQERHGFLGRVRAALSGEQIEWVNSDRPYLDALERFATLGDESSQRSLALEILAEIHRPDSPLATFELLVGLGLWSSHENLFLRRSQIPTQFPPQVLESGQHSLMFPPPDLDQHHRLDLTHLKVYTIDDETTQEIDDGLSLELVAADRECLWVHIADPSRWLTPGDELDLEARRRTTTLYLPTGMVPMFPASLATGPMSLTQGEVCYALSFGIFLDAEGGVEEFKIQPSLIRPTYRLTYEDVDEMLELDLQTEPEVKAIARWAEKRRLWRETQGAISINMPESAIKVAGDQVQIQLLDNSPSRHLVAEMMILAGEVAARYAQEHNLPVPFRQQPQPELPSEAELLQLNPGPVRDCAIRRCMPRSEVSTTAGRHASLGLETYCQTTSPIRRYADLVAHFQIKAHLRGDPLPFAEPDLRLLLTSLTASVQEATLIERQTNRYWCLEYLRCHPNQVWQALMLRWLREYEGLGLVLLEDLGIELAMRFNRAVSVGEQFHLRVIHADPRQDRIELDEVLLPPGEAR